MLPLSTTTPLCLRALSLLAHSSPPHSLPPIHFSAYDGHADWCGFYDNPPDFKSKVMCCGCGGGTTAADTGEGGGSEGGGGGGVGGGGGGEDGANSEPVPGTEPTVGPSAQPTPKPTPPPPTFAPSLRPTKATPLNVPQPPNVNKPAGNTEKGEGDNKAEPESTVDDAEEAPTDNETAEGDNQAEDGRSDRMRSPRGSNFNVNKCANFLTYKTF